MVQRVRDRLRVAVRGRDNEIELIIIALLADRLKLTAEYDGGKLTNRDSLIEQIKDAGNEHRDDSLRFFVYNTLPGTTSAAGAV